MLPKSAIEYIAYSGLQASGLSPSNPGNLGEGSRLKEANAQSLRSIVDKNLGWLRPQPESSGSVGVAEEIHQAMDVRD